MMDYLTGLVARNLELLEAVQPRLASRFELSSPTNGSLPGGSAWRDTTAETQPSSELGTKAHTSTKSPAPPSERSPESNRPWEFQKDFAIPSQHQWDIIADHSLNRRSVQSQGRQSPRDAVTQSVSARHDEAAVQTSNDLSPAKLDQQLRAPSYTEQALSIPALPEKSTIFTTSEGGKQKYRTSSDQKILPTLAERTSLAGSSEMPESSFLPPQHIATARGSVPQPKVSPYVQAPPSPLTEPTRMPQTAPVIRVSIGRVEVRAVMAPQAPPPPRPQARPIPSLSLEDYLKERERGKR